MPQLPSNQASAAFATHSRLEGHDDVTPLLTHNDLYTFHHQPHQSTSHDYEDSRTLNTPLSAPLVDNEKKRKVKTDRKEQSNNRSPRSISPPPLRRARQQHQKQQQYESSRSPARRDHKGRTDEQIEYIDASGKKLRTSARYTF